LYSDFDGNVLISMLVICFIMGEGRNCVRVEKQEKVLLEMRL